jgi:hypothetical protein
LVVCLITFVRFPADGRLRIETCSNIQCDMRYADLRNKSVHFVGLVSLININWSCKVLSGDR